jgi:hypothetical protein
MAELRELQERLDDYRETPGQTRALEHARLDALLVETWKHIDRGSLAAIDLALRISDLRIRLLELEAEDNDTGERDK